MADTLFLWISSNSRSERKRCSNELGRKLIENLKSDSKDVKYETEGEDRCTKWKSKKEIHSFILALILISLPL